MYYDRLVGECIQCGQPTDFYKRRCMIHLSFNLTITLNLVIQEVVTEFNSFWKILILYV